MQSHPKSTQKLKSLRSIVCPQKEKLIVAEITDQFAIPNGQVSWLQCEACQGWHVLIDNYNQDTIAVDNLAQPYGPADSAYGQTPQAV